jgi:hypothetical protein
MPEYLHEIHFTLEEARALLTQVHARVSKLVELKRSLAAQGWDVRRHQYFGGRGPNGDGSFPAELDTLVEIARDLQRQGVLIKDLERGIIDFPALRENGEEVYLCWSLGEDDILAWHTLDAGFAGRRSVREL